MTQEALPPQDQVHERILDARNEPAELTETVSLPPMQPSPSEASLDADGLIVIRGEATIHNISRLWQQLKALDKDIGDRVSIDLSGLTALDTAGAQLLIAFRRNHVFSSVHSCPPPIRQFLELTGLTCVLTSEDCRWHT